MKSRPQWHKKGADQGRRPRLIMKAMKLPTYRWRCFPPVAGSPVEPEKPRSPPSGASPCAQTILPSKNG